MSLQTGRVSFLSTELMAAPDSGDSLERAEAVSQSVQQRDGSGHSVG